MRDSQKTTKPIFGKTTQALFGKTTRPMFTLERPSSTRLVLLLTAGLLLVGGVGLWVMVPRHQEEPTPQVGFAAKGSAPATANGPAAPPAATSSSTPISANRPAAPLAGGQPANPPATPGSSPGRAPATSMPITATRPPAAGTPSQPPAAAVSPAKPLAPVQVNQATASLPPAPAWPQPGQPAAAAPDQAAPPAPGAKSLPATSREEAQAEAHVGAGRPNPCTDLSGLKPFPRNRAFLADRPGMTAESGMPPSKTPPMVPPPPPRAEDALGAGVDGGIALTELPVPPAKPSLADKMKLIGVIGDRAVLAFSDTQLRQENRWPKTLILKPGEQFETVSVLGVNPDSVTLEEDGERSVKNIEPIKR